ncbi:EAL domain-containing protein [Porticoccus sp. W117]|uniref:sensor domain-containing protein n=1 Tax=Porticoccus sp. W117 TaxID=3054777 RepID=UPI00259469D1|nr:EAL domain-containing protein [Porticoccus sp. W117]MDM3870121.1 EAL domain-containing protein [Porticoccus sp. W117]
MSSKEELYKVLLEISPYGTLFFVYGVCIECNDKAMTLLGCERSHLIGASLDEISGDESSALIDLKLQLKRAVNSDQKRLQWRCPQGSGDGVDIDLCIEPVPHNPREFVVTLMEARANSQAQPLSPQPVRQPENAAPQQTAEPEPPAINRPEQKEDPEQVLQAAMSAAARAVKEKPEVAEPRQASPETEVVEQEVVVEPPSAAQEAPKQTHQDRVFDSLTKLPNRQFLIESLDKYFDATRTEEICGALLMIDLDNFKDINDSWGHTVGDQVVKKVGSAIAHIVRGDNVLARLGGDEFVLFIPQISDSVSQAAWDAQAMAEKVRESIANPIFIDGHELVLTASIGIALLTDNDLTSERALQYADSAMYESKRKGRNGIAFFDPYITEKAQRQIGLNIRLRKALDNQEFALYIQPQIEVDTGRVIGGEALLRWVNTEKSHNMPSEFIPVLESSGLIVNVGHWVIRTACEYLRNFIDEGIWRDGMQMGINISPRQFRDPQLLEVVQHSITSYNVDPRHLNFEVTENLLIEDVDEVVSKMNAIKSLGSCFSIDDFGIGYSSMIYLKRLPFDHLKIDREFIRNIHRDPESRGVVEAIMAVSRQYGLQVIAEGVENAEALNVLTKVGCDSYQGAHYSMPVPVDRFRELLVA